ncbi:hypothetical protein [Pedobacter sp. SYP-B3415]|uniref:hypothetical protein n=1 Tax=Pedobacter sp. SYP-B3415 TaxID=2496641 RepID=UPI00101B8119|nr:hypothetical protein [Pedobacter sp. SYP-B3415]
MNLFNVLLALHIAGGGISLLSGLIVLFLKKGGRTHRLIGNIYFYSLITASLVSLPMAYLHPNLFLFIVGVFTTYMLLTGKLYLTKKTCRDVRPGDWILSVIMLLFSVMFLVIGAINLYKGVFFGLVLVVFGLISLSFVRQDWINFKGKSPAVNSWLTTHLQRMVGSYIASATAFLVVNNHFLPGTVAWLLPTVVLTPLIVRWSKKYLVLKKVV